MCSKILQSQNAMMLKTAVLFSGILTLAWSQSTSVSQCTRSSGPLPINTYIEGCSTPPCRLPQLQDVVLHVIFRAPYLMHSMTTLANAFLPLMPLAIPYPLGDESVTCNFLTNTYCPVLEGEVVSYTLRMYIESFFPAGTNANVEFSIVDEMNVPVICFRLAISILNPLSGVSSDVNAPTGNATIPLKIKEIKRNL